MSVEIERICSEWLVVYQEQEEDVASITLHTSDVARLVDRALVGTLSGAQRLGEKTSPEHREGTLGDVVS